MQKFRKGSCCTKVQVINPDRKAEFHGDLVKYCPTDAIENPYGRNWEAQVQPKYIDRRIHYWESHRFHLEVCEGRNVKPTKTKEIVG